MSPSRIDKRIAVAQDNQLMPAMSDELVPMPVYTTYTYRVPRQFHGAVVAGMRVLVPFGRRQITAYVLGGAEKPPESADLKSVTDLLDDEPLFPGEIVPFFRWTADYYLHPIGEVIQTGPACRFHR